MAIASKAKRPTRRSARSCLGPVARSRGASPRRVVAQALQRALREDRRRRRREQREHAPRGRFHRRRRRRSSRTATILDLCCGQGRHCLELARRGFKNVHGRRPLALPRSGSPRSARRPRACRSCSRKATRAIRVCPRAASTASPSWATRSATSPTSRTTRRC